MSWNHPRTLNARVYRCGFCQEKVSSSIGYDTTGASQFIYICPNCDEATYFNLSKNRQSPGVIFGNKVNNVPKDIENLYDEARNCMMVRSYTASVMACRKLLMNIAVEKGEKEGLTYKEYIDFLEKNHYAPPNSKDWIDHIREKGNEANHEIKIMKEEDAEELISLIEMLLKFIYEFPSKMKIKK